MIEEEFARVLVAASREGSTLSPVLRSAWDTGSLRVLTRQEPIVATGCHISVVAHCTLEEMRKRLSRIDMANGFANRFLFVRAHRSKLLPEGGSLPEEEFSRLSRISRTALEEARTVGEVRRDSDAQELWREIYTEMGEGGRHRHVRGRHRSG